VRASDKRARFVGLPAYEAAGGNVLRDLFEEDGGGWLEDIALLERLVADKRGQKLRLSPPKTGSGST
jgi:ParB family transcriptional regulator, chromosome partitioning protein